MEHLFTKFSTRVGHLNSFLALQSGNLNKSFFNAWGEGCDSFELIGALHTVLISLRFVSKAREIGMYAQDLPGIRSTYCLFWHVNKLHCLLH